MRKNADALVRDASRIEQVAGARGRESPDSNKLGVCVGNGTDALVAPGNRQRPACL